MELDDTLVLGEGIKTEYIATEIAERLIKALGYSNEEYEESVEIINDVLEIVFSKRSKAITEQSIKRRRSIIEKETFI